MDTNSSSKSLAVPQAKLHVWTWTGFVSIFSIQFSSPAHSKDLSTLMLFLL